MSNRNRKLYTIRSSYLYQAKHINDSYKNLGFKYSGQILKKGTSPELWANPLQQSMFQTIESMLIFLIENAKMIKKWYSIAHSKDTTNIN